MDGTLAFLRSAVEVGEMIYMCMRGVHVPTTRAAHGSREETRRELSDFFFRILLSGLFSS